MDLADRINKPQNIGTPNSAAATDVGPFGPVKKKKKKPAVLSKIEQAQAEINGRIDNKFTKIQQDRIDAEARKAEEDRLAREKRLAEEEERKKMMDKKSTIQNWVNNIAEENESEVSSGSSISKPPIQTKKAQKETPVVQPPAPKAAPPKVKPKYTTSGRRTSSMSGIDIAKKVDLAKLPQPADLSVPFVKDAELKKTPKKKQVVEKTEPDWSIVDLQQGFDSEETSSYEMIDPFVEVEDGYEQVFSVRVYAQVSNSFLRVLLKHKINAIKC